jgi:WD40 repeat protein
MLLTSASLDRTIRLWDVASNVGLVVFRRRSRINSVAIMSQLVAIGDDEGVCVIEPQSEG